MSDEAPVLEAREPSARYLATAEVATGFELLASSPAGAVKLRGLIHSLAVRGRLTLRANGDGTAMELLAQLDPGNANRAASQEANYRNSRVLVNGVDLRFPIPCEWCWVRLGDVTNYGSCEKAAGTKDETWVLDLEDVEKETGRVLQWKTFAERRSLSDKNVFRRGDVLFGKLRPYLNKVLVADRDGVCSTEIVPFRPAASIDPGFVSIALRSPYYLEYVNSRSYGMKMPRLGTEQGRSAPIPLPPLGEQRRIVARVEELMKLCDALEQNGRFADEQHARLRSTLFDALVASESQHELAENWQRVAEHFDLLLDRSEAIDALEETVLQLAVRGLLVVQVDRDKAIDLLTRDAALAERAREKRRGVVAGGGVMGDMPFEAPLGWVWSRFHEIARIASDLVQPANYRDAWQIAPDCIEKGTGRLLYRRTVREAAIISANHRFVAGQILYSKIRPSLAKAILVDFDGLCSADMYPIEARIDAQYLLLVMLSRVFLEQVKEAENRVKMPKLNQEALNSFLVPVPPLAEQHRIVARVEELRRLCADLRQRLTQARETQSRLADTLVSDLA